MASPVLPFFTPFNLSLVMLQRKPSTLKYCTKNCLTFDCFKSVTVAFLPKLLNNKSPHELYHINYSHFQNIDYVAHLSHRSLCKGYYSNDNILE